MQGAADDDQEGPSRRAGYFHYGGENRGEFVRDLRLRSLH